MMALDLTFAVTGMTWSAFSSNDDCCQYSYLIPSNMFAVWSWVMSKIFAELDLADIQNIVADAKRLQEEIKKASKTTPTQLIARVKRFTPLKWMV